jgi:hypothetical protein
MIGEGLRKTEERRYESGQQKIYENGGERSSEMKDEGV